MNAAISLITCTRGRTSQLERLLSSLIVQSEKKFELIIVDQNEGDILSPLLGRYCGALNLLHLRSEKGLSLGRNVGLRRASGQLIGFPDDDCWYDANAVKSVLESFSRYPEADVITGRTCDAHGIQSVSSSPRNSQTINLQSIFLAGNSNAIFFTRSCILSVGYFDVRLGVGSEGIFQAGEETDMLIRALAKNHIIQYDSDIMIRHDQPSNLRPDLLKRAKTYGAGTGGLLRKHNFGFGSIAIRSIYVVGGAIKRILRRSNPDLESKIIFLFFMIKGYVLWNN